MSGSRTYEIELGVDLVAAALFASAIAFAVARVGAPLELAAAALIVGFVGSYLGLRGIIVDDAKYQLAEFALEEPQFEEVEELVLTHADRLEADAPEAPAEGELLLDDVLAEIGTDSRVVRLFDASAMPTAGELQSRIDEHLSRAPGSDASQALHDALADLRRSLR